MTFPSYNSLKIAESYKDDLQQVVAEEFKASIDETYVDHAAAALYSTIQIQDAYHSLSSNLYGNPHSRHAPSDMTTQIIDATRTRILNHFNTDSSKYNVIFTSGASSAIKIVADSFQFSTKDSQFKGSLVYAKENHTSAIGIRGAAQSQTTDIYPLSVKELANLLKTRSCKSNNVFTSNGLFVYSPHCNYSGAKYPLAWIEEVQNGKLNTVLKNNQESPHWYVLLDAACLVATCPLDLTKYQPDFVPISFYKIFGYPTGIGCLLVSKRAESTLVRTYFGGGTVEMVDVATNIVYRRKTLHERFEDGTLPFLNIVALEYGFRTIRRITGGMENISRHVFNVARYFHHNLKSMRHSNNAPVAIIYNESDHWTLETHGSIVNFNILNEEGRHVGFYQGERFSSLYNIHLRTGCVCNPGACERYLNISQELKQNHFKTGHVCGDAMDLVNGHPTGSVRVSFGYSSRYEDADKVLIMINECFVNKPLKMNGDWLSKESNIVENFTIPEKIVNILPASQNLILTDILVYPVKSCGAMSVKQWTIGSTGFDFDRQWMVVLETGVILTLKRAPSLSQITPYVDIARNVLTLSAPGHQPVDISLEVDNNLDNSIESYLCGVKVCGQKVQTQDCGPIVAKWLADVLKMDGVRLVRQIQPRKNRKQDDGEKNENLSLANESQFLVVHRSSIRCLMESIRQHNSEEEISENDLMLRFRANLVVDGGYPFEEDNWVSHGLSIGEHQFKVKSLCTRCQMVCVSPGTGERTKEPLLSLAKLRGSNIKFGLHTFHISHINKDPIIVNSTVMIET